MEHGACEQCGVALLLSDEEVHGALVTAQVLQSGDAACVATQARATAAFAELEDGDGAGERSTILVCQSTWCLW